MTVSDNGRALESRNAELPDQRAAFWIWLRIGCLSFGGPAGQIALMHRELVEIRNLIGERRFLHALNFCSLLPGPEAQQLAAYLGWLMHGAVGGWVAGILFILPGAAVMLILSVVFVTAGDVPAVSAIFFGITCAVVAIVFDALRRIATKALRGPLPWCVAIAAFAALFIWAVPFPLVVLAAGLIGLVWPAAFAGHGHDAGGTGEAAVLDRILSDDPERPKRLAGSARRAGLIALALWLVPVLVLAAYGGLFGDIAVFFSKMAVVTFGGAYAVLAYVAQEAVGTYGWIDPQDMLTGLGLAETTPGPLILVLQFVGFLAGHGVHGMAGGLLAAALTLWVTFAPCFAFVFLGAPIVESLARNERVAGALGGILAGAVGVIANLAVWFGLRRAFAMQETPNWGPDTLTLPVLNSVDPIALAIIGVAVATACLWRIGTAKVLAVSAVLGLASSLLT